MSRVKYYYNVETCCYEKVTRSKQHIILKVLTYFFIFFMLTGGSIPLYQKYFDSPKEAELRKVNDHLRSQYASLQKEIDKSNVLLSSLQERDNNLYRTLLEAEPIPATVLAAGVGGSTAHISLSRDELINQVATNLKKLHMKMHVQKKSYDELATLAQSKEKLLAAIPAIQPVANKDLSRLSSGFGMRLHPIYKVMRFHHGIDFTAPRGTPIYATGNGVVKAITRSNTGYGNQIVIDHGFGFLTRYAHMQGFKVSVGQKVSRGQCIGTIGTTGCSSGPHLHYEVIKNGKKVNPAHYILSGLTAKEYDALLRLAAVQNRSLD